MNTAAATPTVTMAGLARSVVAVTSPRISRSLASMSSRSIRFEGVTEMVRFARTLGAARSSGLASRCLGDPADEDDGDDQAEDDDRQVRRPGQVAAEVLAGLGL